MADAGQQASSASADDIRIRVVRLSPEYVFEVHAPRSMQIIDFKRRLEEQTGTPAALQRLIYRGRVLKNNNDGTPATLEHYEVC